MRIEGPLKNEGEGEEWGLGVHIEGPLKNENRGSAQFLKSFISVGMLP